MASENLIAKIDALSIVYKRIASGKVRELFEADDRTLLIVATDRISAYDVILENDIPYKGAMLNQLSAHWFDLISAVLPTLKTHLITANIPDSFPASIPPSPLPPSLQCRSMLVHRLPVIPLESIVRGYITGSAWSEYKSKGTVHGMLMPKGLQESEKFDKAIWTPSTKAKQGEHDENISRERAMELVGEDVAKRVEEASLKIYEMARDYAEKRGIIIADTKFEFGLDPNSNEIVLIDEVLTPDSSRFWPADKYEVGKSQSSYDKQYLRDWLTSSGLKGKQGVHMPEEVVMETESRYREAFEKLTGRQFSSP